MQDFNSLRMDRAEGRRAMNASLLVGAGMLILKSFAWWITGSAAILSDALESVIHIAAVGFAAFSFWLSQRPAEHRYPYGFDRISYFSAGFEGALIILAAAGIFFSSIREWMNGLHLQRVGFGLWILVGLAAINGALSWYLIRTGKRLGLIILEANGRHVLADCVTTAGVIAGLLLVMLTGWLPLDPICAILVACNIVWSGAQLVWQSARGLLDYADPETDATLRSLLDRSVTEVGGTWHGLRFREAGGRLMADVHLLFPSSFSLGEAHRRATLVEDQVATALKRPVDITSHLEAVEDHEAIHLHAHG
jgi:cation diffusion facilitator family transporter